MSSELYLELSEAHKSLYADECMAAECIESAQQLASIIGEERFLSQEDAEAYLKRVLPFLPPKPPASVVYEATGEGVTLPSYILKPTSEKAKSLEPAETYQHQTTDPTVSGMFEAYDLEVIDTKEGELPYVVRLNMLLDLPDAKSYRVHKLIKLNDIQLVAEVSMHGTAHIAPVRLNQLDEVKRIMGASKCPDLVNQLMMNLIMIDQEIITDVDENYRPLQSIKRLREAGRIASQMLRLAGPDISERHEITKLLRYGIDLEGRTVLIACGGMMLARSVKKETDEKIGKPLSLRSQKDRPLEGNVIGITERFRSRGGRRMPPNIPHFVIIAQLQNTTTHKVEDIYSYPALTKITSFAY